MAQGLATLLEIGLGLEIEIAAEVAAAAKGPGVDTLASGCLISSTPKGGTAAGSSEDGAAASVDIDPGVGIGRAGSITSPRPKQSRVPPSRQKGMSEPRAVAMACRSAAVKPQPQSALSPTRVAAPSLEPPPGRRRSGSFC